MNAKLCTAMAMTLALGACASMPQPSAALENARTAVRTAEVDPMVNKYAALDLDVARKDLNNAEQAALQHNESAVNQSAYLATQNARLAQAHAASKADDAKVASGQAERDQIMLAARTHEVDNAKRQRDQANEETARVQAELDALKATPTVRGMVVTVGDVLFDTGQANLKSGAGRKIDQLAQFLEEHPDRRVQIDGFTDSVGTDSYNEELSQRRADAVRSALISQGVDASRIGTEGYGKSYPVANNNDASGRQLNRRVEVVIGGDNGAPISRRTGLALNEK
jgi:outer membrane protein OmpA-like peptidoglycan-associated protein